MTIGIFDDSRDPNDQDGFEAAVRELRARIERGETSGRIIFDQKQVTATPILIDGNTTKQ